MYQRAMQRATAVAMMTMTMQPQSPVLAAVEIAEGVRDHATARVVAAAGPVHKAGWVMPDL